MPPLRKVDLEAEITHLNELLAKRGRNKTRTSAYFILINSNTKPSQYETEQDIARKLKNIILYLSENLDEVVTFNKQGHAWSSDYIEDVNIKFAIERGVGRRRKDGTYPDSGGTVHAHVILTIHHKSNITIPRTAISDLLQPELEMNFGKKGFVSPPRLIAQNMLEHYITKSDKYKNGHEWVTL